MAAPRSARKGHTIQQLRSLKQSGYYNADTGTELDEGEADDYLHRLEQNSADRHVEKYIKTMNSYKVKTRSQGRPWIPKGQVEFRTINGNKVPFPMGTNHLKFGEVPF